MSNKPIKQLITPTYLLGTTGDLTGSDLGYYPIDSFTLSLLSGNDAGDIKSLISAADTNHTHTISGDLAGSGSSNITVTLPNTGVTPGTYNTASSINPFTVDAKGRITGIGPAQTPITNWNIINGKPSTFPPSTHGHPWSDISGKPTTLSGYGITNAQPLNSNLTNLGNLFPTTQHMIVGNGLTWSVQSPATVRGNLGLNWTKVMDLTPINGYSSVAGWPNELWVCGNLVMIRYSASKSHVVNNEIILSWSGYAANSTCGTSSVSNPRGGAVYIQASGSALEFIISDMPVGTNLQWLVGSLIYITT